MDVNATDSGQLLVAKVHPAARVEFWAVTDEENEVLGLSRLALLLTAASLVRLPREEVMRYGNTACERIRGAWPDAPDGWFGTEVDVVAAERIDGADWILRRQSEGQISLVTGDGGPGLDDVDRSIWAAEAAISCVSHSLGENGWALGHGLATMLEILMLEEEWGWDRCQEMANSCAQLAAQAAVQGENAKNQGGRKPTGVRDVLDFLGIFPPDVYVQRFTVLLTQASDDSEQVQQARIEWLYVTEHALRTGIKRWCDHEFVEPMLQLLEEECLVMYNQIAPGLSALAESMLDLFDQALGLEPSQRAPETALASLLPLFTPLREPALIDELCKSFVTCLVHTGINLRVRLIFFHFAADCD